MSRQEMPSQAAMAHHNVQGEGRMTVFAQRAR